MDEHKTRVNDGSATEPWSNGDGLRDFEASWRAGDRPTIEATFAQAGPIHPDSFLESLIAAEIRLRLERGDRPSPDEYLARFPDHATVIFAAFRSDSSTSIRSSLADETLVKKERVGDQPSADDDPTRSTRSWPARRKGGEGPGSEDGGSPKAGCRYRIVSHHKSGGLGEIYLAEDLELGRSVALKEIKERHAGDHQSRARFLLEAEVTGKLEHPGIVPIHGLGRYHDGRPFYAMRFVEGDSLREAIDRFHEGKASRPRGEHELMFRALLGRFLDVCDAIHYAHSRGVLHRDLKPGNVMLGRFGETLVVDWGLAKILDTGAGVNAETANSPIRLQFADGVDPTRVHAALGTPGYMSPEQATGKVDLIGPASDIYSLGASLYCLLTGHSPSRNPDHADVESPSRRGNPSSTGKLRRDIPAPLASICSKAMEPEPDRRYHSPRALADDIERWLADEPVSVHEYAVTAKLGRWVRRHRPLVAAAVALLITLSIALAVSNLMIRVQEKRAEENFQVALEAVDLMLARVSHEKLMNVPQMSELRSELADDAARFHKKLLDKRPRDPELRYTYAMSRAKSAYNHKLLGHRDRFLEDYEEVIGVYNNLIADDPDNLQYVKALAYAKIEKGSAIHESGRIRAAISLFREAMGAAVGLVAREPESDKFRFTMARAAMHLGPALISVGEYPEAKGHYDGAIERLTPIVQERPKDHLYRNHLIQLLHGRAKVAAETGDPAVAGRMFSAALSQVDRLRQEGASPVDADTFRASVLVERGFWLGSAQDSPLASETDLDEAERLLGKLVADFPAIHVYNHWRAAALYRRGLARARLDPEKRRMAAADFERAIEILETLLERDPSLSGARSHLGQAHGGLGNWLLDHGDREQAISRLTRAIALQERCLEENKESPIDRKILESHKESLRRAGLKPAG